MDGWEAQRLPTCHAQAAHFGQAFASLWEQPSLPCPSLTSGCQHTMQPALLLSPSPWSPHPPFPHKEQSRTLYVGLSLADPMQACLSQAIWHQSSTLLHWVSVSPWGLGGSHGPAGHSQSPDLSPLSPQTLIHPMNSD